MPDIVYIGRVKWVHENHEKAYRHATVEPLIQSSADQKRWTGSIEDPIDEFPARGLAYWHDAPKGLEVGDYRQFDIEPHPFYNGQPDKEAFRVRNNKYPTEIIDLRDIGSERDIRILLTTKGVLLNKRPLVERCVLWIQDEKWIGPVNLARRSGTNSWGLAPSQQLDSIQCWNIPAGAIQQVELEGPRYLLTPNQDSLGQHIGFVTWEADENLAKRVLNRLLRRDRKAAEALKISKDVFKTYIDIIEKAGLIGSNLDQELSFRERIQEIVGVITKNEELLEEAASVFFTIAPVKQQIEKKAKEEYEKKLSEYETQLDTDLAAKKQEIKAAETDLKEKRSQLASLQVRIATADQEMAERVSKFESELTERLRKIAEKPERLFAEMAFFEAITSAVRPVCSTTVREVPRLRAADLPKAPAVRDPNALMGEFSQRLLSIGVSPQVGQALHCALSSGTVPVVIGPDGLDVVRSYADCVSGGLLHWIPVGGTLFDPSDLLGRVEPSSHSFIPHPGGLLDLLLDDSDAVHLVILDGFNRAAVDGYLLPLLQLLRDEAEGPSRLTISLVSPGTARDGDPYGAVNRVAWNPNVLLVLRPATGTSVLPVPRELWEHCVLIDTESPAAVMKLPPMKPTRVSKTDWNSWLNRALSLSKPLDRFSDHPNGRSQLPRTIRRKIERILGSGVALGLNPDRAADQALKLSLVPYLVTYGEPMDEWLKVLSFELDEQDRRVEDIVRRLGE